jgi:hypothetical protein
MISNKARTPWPSTSCSNRRRIRGFLLIPAVDAGSTTVCTTLQKLPAGQPLAVKMAVQNNRRTRALSATAFDSRAALRADETARVKRGVARRTRPFETKRFSRDRDSRREFSTRVQHCVRAGLQGGRILEEERGFSLFFLGNAFFGLFFFTMSIYIGTKQ